MKARKMLVIVVPLMLGFWIVAIYLVVRIVKYAWGG